jgi:hypothetical protein
LADHGAGRVLGAEEFFFSFFLLADHASPRAATARRVDVASADRNRLRADLLGCHVRDLPLELAAVAVDGQPRLFRARDPEVVMRVIPSLPTHQVSGARHLDGWRLMGEAVGRRLSSMRPRAGRRARSRKMPKALGVSGGHHPAERAQSPSWMICRLGHLDVFHDE